MSFKIASKSLSSIMLLKVTLSFLALTLMENLGFPYMANHGHFDFSNSDFKPYLRLSLFAFIELAFITVLLFKKPLPGSLLYLFSKIILPAAGLTMTVNIVRIFGSMPWGWGASSVIIFTLHMSGAVAAVLLSIRFLRNMEILGSK